MIHHTASADLVQPPPRAPEASPRLGAALGEVPREGRREDIGAVLGWARATVAPALRAAIEALPPRIGKIAAYHFGWNDLSGGDTGLAEDETWGKGVRSALVLACAEAVGGHAAAAVPAAVAVELWHNASLLHDDLIDGDTMRRHRPTVWAAYSPAAATLAGDALFAAAVQVLGNATPQRAGEASGALLAAVQLLIEGEFTDVELELRLDVSVDEYTKMAKGKTAALLGCACALGARLGGAGWGRVETLREFGVCLGLVFQAVDDSLALWGSSDHTGKPVLADLRRRKPNLAIIVALQSRTPAAAELAAILRGADPLTEGQVERAGYLIDQTGARQWVHSYARRQLDEASKYLALAEPTARGAELLSGLAHLVLTRNT